MAPLPVAHSLTGRATRARCQSLLAACLCALALGGCASGKPQRVSLVPVDMTESAGRLQLSREVVAKLPNDAAVTLPSGSQWRRAGAIVQGDVFRPLGGPFAIALPRHTEAYLVASSGKLVGFYLPVDSSYIELSLPVVLPGAVRQ
ncbi:hypothetical protein [Achromobacter xylosoxidans]|uniref:hypothetical protein n=1 Tax=Achromobacter TaxID=222 RepID=UPI0006C33445|nr:hypothetical protein [Achromobacter xylosoxidans]CUI73836.1 Uncharacterised protein [Achromobacter xylosoxidans]